MSFVIQVPLCPVRGAPAQARTTRSNTVSALMRKRPLRNVRRSVLERWTSSGVPEDGLSLVVPGEDAERVGEHEPLWREITPDRQQAVLRVLDGGEDEALVELVNGHEGILLISARESFAIR